MATFPLEASLHVFVIATDASAELLENSFLLVFPVLLATLFKHTIELLLRVLSPLFDRGYEVLLMGMSEVSSYICVLKGLER